MGSVEGYGKSFGLFIFLCLNEYSAAHTYPGMDSWTVPFSYPQFSAIPMCIFTSRSVVMLYLYYSDAFRCRAYSFTAYLPQNHQLTRWNWFYDCCVSMVPWFFLRGGIHKVPGVWQGSHMLFVLLAGVHTSPLVTREQMSPLCNFPRGCNFPQIIMGSWISVSLCIILYPSLCSGANILHPCTYILIVCMRWCC